uniref:Uncharacterized protein n=1 Tax=Auxenochlorella protothecoides TaxID=3075 RepID=A0A1D1ZZ54_AUXPR
MHPSSTPTTPLIVPRPPPPTPQPVWRGAALPGRPWSTPSPGRPRSSAGGWPPRVRGLPRRLQGPSAPDPGLRCAPVSLQLSLLPPFLRPRWARLWRSLLERTLRRGRALHPPRRGRACSPLGSRLADRRTPRQQAAGSKVVWRATGTPGRAAPGSGEVPRRRRVDRQALAVARAPHIRAPGLCCPMGGRPNNGPDPRARSRGPALGRWPPRSQGRTRPSPCIPMQGICCRGGLRPIITHWAVLRPRPACRASPRPRPSRACARRPCPACPPSSWACCWPTCRRSRHSRLGSRRCTVPSRPAPRPTRGSCRPATSSGWRARSSSSRPRSSSSSFQGRRSSSSQRTPSMRCRDSSTQRAWGRAWRGSHAWRQGLPRGVRP